MASIPKTERLNVILKDLRRCDMLPTAELWKLCHSAADSLEAYSQEMLREEAHSLRLARTIKKMRENHGNN